MVSQVSFKAFLVRTCGTFLDRMVVKRRRKLIGTSTRQLWIFEQTDYFRERVLNEYCENMLTLYEIEVAKMELSHHLFHFVKHSVEVAVKQRVEWRNVILIGYIIRSVEGIGRTEAVSAEHSSNKIIIHFLFLLFEYSFLLKNF